MNTTATRFSVRMILAVVISLLMCGLFSNVAVAQPAVPPPPPDPFAQIIQQAQGLGQQLGLPVLPPTEQTPVAEPVPTEAPAPATAQEATPEFAIIGDSYGSGNGDQGTPNAPRPQRYTAATTLADVNFCLRTMTSAAQLAARNMGFDIAQTRDHSCTSATASNVLDEVQYNEGLQINAFNANTQYGVYEQGGNPYFMPAFECILMTFPANGQTCPQSHFDQAMTYYTQVLPDLTRRNLQAIHERSPQLEGLAVPLYPPVMPLTDNLGTCAWFADMGELYNARALFNALNTTIRNVVAEFAQHNFFIVDPLAEGSPFLQRDAAGNGTDACSPNLGLTAFWLLRAGAPLNPANYIGMDLGAILNDVIAGTLHPNTRGWEWMSGLITSGFRAHAR